MTASNAFRRPHKAFAFSSVEAFRNSLYVQLALQLWRTEAQATNESFTLALALFLFLLLATGSAWSLDPDRHISQYGHTAWRIQDGFLGGSARSITQTTDGDIWIGTEAGLF